MSNPILRALTTADYEQSMKLSCFAFQMPLSNEQLEERRAGFLTSNDVRFGIFNEDELCAQATLLHLNVYVNGQLFKMGGIAGVSTWAEYRRQGYVAQLLKQLLLEMRQSGQSISMLHPFSFSFYRKFGWEAYVDYKKYEMSSEHLASMLKELGTKQLGNVKRLEDWQPLASVYDQYARVFNGMLVRTESWWSERVRKRKPGIIAGAYNDQQELVGYIIYEVANRVMTIHEFIALTAKAEQQLLLYIAQHDSMVEHVNWTAPIDDCFTYGLHNPRIKQEIIPYFMARIVDVESFIAQYLFKPSEQEDVIVLTVEDEHAAWNNGQYILRIASSGKATLTKDDQIKSSSELTISIGAFTAWLLNYKKYEVLQRFDQIIGDEQTMKRLQSRIAEHTSYLTDFF